MICRSVAALADHCFMSCNPTAFPCARQQARLGLPGRGRAVFEGFYTVRFQVDDAVGRSVMYARDGKMLGGNSAFAHIGTYEEVDGEVITEIKTIRHNPDPNYRAMAGSDDATLTARGKPDGALYRF